MSANAAKFCPDWLSKEIDISKYIETLIWQHFPETQLDTFSNEKKIEIIKKGGFKRSQTISDSLKDRPTTNLKSLQGKFYRSLQITPQSWNEVRHIADLKAVAMGLFTLRLLDKRMYHQIILATLWVSICVPVSNSASDDGTAPNDNRTCTDPECQDLAAMIRRQMGSKKPCEDFHNYVCGNWEGDRELKSVLLKKKAVNTLLGLLENASEPLQVSNTTHKLIRAFKSCTGKGEDENALRTSIRNVITGYNVTNKTWPIIEENKARTTRRVSNDYLDVLKNTGPRPVFSYSVYQQDGKPFIFMTKPSEFYVNEVDNSDSTIPRDAEEPSDSTTEEYNYDEMDAENEKAYKEFIMKTITLLNKTIGTNDAENAAEDIIKTEKDLSKLARAQLEPGRQKMNLSDLDSLLGGTFPMTEILRRDFQDLNININGATEVLVEYIQYFKDAVNLLKCTTMESLSNYVFWTKIRKMAEAEGTPLHKIYLQFKHNHSFFVEDYHRNDSTHETKELGLRCVLQLLEEDIMYTAGANYYLTAKFNESSKDDVLKLMEFINSSFIYVVKNNTWMSEHTKQAAIMMLHKMNPIIGYPDWMLNETILNSLYKFVPVIAETASFVEHFHHLGENEHKRTLLQLDPEAYINKTNEDVPLRSHASYDETTDTLVYPAAALVTHYRRPPIPRAVIFGTIGTILAQLLTNIIDRYNYALNGTIRYNNDTWDNETRTNFCGRSSCLNNTDECNDTITPSSEKYEKLRDYLGVRISYQAMVRSKDNYTLPYLLPDENKTFDSESKIFFILFGSLYCPYSVNEKRFNEEVVEARSQDEEVDDKFHNSLNEIVYTYKDFNKTFNCNIIEGVDTCDLMPPDKPTQPINC